ncbi:MAG: ABC transporter ATP-binding protein [Firmicutes bacterium]|nr:ABC transporter ATP-binding protein [Bacillota bacterium]
MEREILRIENLYFNYSDAPVLRDVNFTLHKGDFLGVIGANGAGKSTLLKLILGLLPPDKGEIYVHGESVKKTRPQIGYVSQKANSFNIDFPATVKEVVMSGIRKRMFSAYNRADRDKLDDVLKKVGIFEYRDKLIGRLSGGQQQRAFIARALIADNDIIILDEPTVGIDAVSVRGIMELISEINSRGITIIMTNHDTPSLTAAANKLLVFCEHGNGELLDKASLTDAELDEIYAGRRGHHHA